MRRAAGPLLLVLFFISVFVAGLIIGVYNPISPQSSPATTSDDSSQSQSGLWGWFTKDSAGFFTFGLFVVGTAQILLFAWQLRLIHKSLSDTKEAADASAEAAKAATRQAKVAEEILSKKERPYLFVFGVRYLKKNKEFHSFYVDFSIANFGATPAIIEEAFFDVMSSKGEPDEPGYIGDWHSLVRDNIISSDERRENLALNIRHDLVDAETGGVIIVSHKDGTNDQYPILSFNVEDGESIFCRIIIKYSGPFSRDHVVSAAWIYDYNMSEFVKWGGEKYNYWK